ncbi:unnamed protein product [Schistosoma margrebowiei]|uniref:Uncharacterized protein n=1 Tax=Schistosoma margrebowiei TaxID=48269 RepID=A0A3P7WEB4_9TREM|nr:unnamed protein product [Schistosoma margrebowiei]
MKSYLQTMNVFSLHETIKQEFLRKQADLFNLNDGMIFWFVINMIRF